MDLKQHIKKILNEEYSNQLRRRLLSKHDQIIHFIKRAQNVIPNDFDDEYEYATEIVNMVVNILQQMYGDEDNFWYDEEYEIRDYIKSEYDDWLF